MSESGNFKPAKSGNFSPALTIKDKGFFDSDYVYVFLKFPSKFSVYDDNQFLKILTLSGATDTAQELLAYFKNSNYYDSLKKSIKIRPEQYVWGICHAIEDKKNEIYNIDFKEAFHGISLILTNKKRNHAHIEFYLDFDYILNEYEKIKNYNKEVADWIYDNCLSEIIVDIDFHNQYACLYNISKNNNPSDDIKNQFFYYVLFTDANTWNSESSASNRSFTILVRD